MPTSKRYAKRPHASSARMEIGKSTIRSLSCRLTVQLNPSPDGDRNRSQSGSSLNQAGGRTSFGFFCRLLYSVRLCIFHVFAHFFVVSCFFSSQNCKDIFVPVRMSVQQGLVEVYLIFSCSGPYWRKGFFKDLLLREIFY